MACSPFWPLFRGQDTAQVSGVTTQKHVTIFSWFLHRNNPLTLISTAKLEKESPGSFQTKATSGKAQRSWCCWSWWGRTTKDAFVTVTWEFPALANEVWPPGKTKFRLYSNSKWFCFWDEDSAITPEYFHALFFLMTHEYVDPHFPEAFSGLFRVGMFFRVGSPWFLIPQDSAYKLPPLGSLLRRTWHCAPKERR